MIHVTLWQDDERVRADFHAGDARGVLSKMPQGCVHTVVTSPPYWGLRKYDGDQDSTWADGWIGSLGLEPTPEQYVEHLCEILDVGLRRVLRVDGTLWLNLGDSYANHPASAVNRQGMTGTLNNGKTEFDCRTGTRGGQERRKIPSGLKAKDLVGIPWLIAFAMRSRGWYLRSAMPWVKRNPMPSSVRDRPGTGTETIFLFAHPDSKGRYFYDVEATKVASTGQGGRAANFARATKEADAPNQKYKQHRQERAPTHDKGTRNRRDTDFFFASLDAIRDVKAQILLHADDGESQPGTVDADHPTPLALTVNPKPFRQAHFAVFPPRLVEPMIKAGTSEHGCCAECAAPWKRPKTGVWEPTCDHADAERVPCTVLDTFGGAGTVAMVANQLGRRALYIDRAEPYLDMAVDRVDLETT